MGIYYKNKYLTSFCNKTKIQVIKIPVKNKELIQDIQDRLVFLKSWTREEQLSIGTCKTNTKKVSCLDTPTSKLRFSDQRAMRVRIVSNEEENSKEERNIYTCHLITENLCIMVREQDPANELPLFGESCQ